MTTEELRHLLPAVNAALNSLSAILLVVGWVSIRQRRIGLHKGAMIAALVVSALFLTSYLYYHFAVQVTTPFSGPDWLRPAYLVILISHVVLAMVVTPMALISAYLGLRNQLASHVRLARWTMPIWLYVSVTGVIVYLMLYQLFPRP